MIIEKLVNDERFSALKERQCYEVLTFLLDNNYEFGVICEVENVTFKPELPESIAGKINSVTLFMLAGYSFESASIEDYCLLFEAGFGPSNFESLVSIPLESIIQIVIDQSVLFMNVAAGEKKRRDEEEKEAIETSTNIFLSNPDNAKFFK